MSNRVMEEPNTSSHRNHSRRHKLNILTILFILQLILNGFLIFIIIYLSAGSLKKIDGCRKDLDVLKQELKSPKLTSEFRDKKDIKTSAGAKSFGNKSDKIQKQYDDSGASKRSLKANTKHNCPFKSSKKQQLCLYVQNEVSKQIENLRHKIEQLDKEIKTSKEVSKHEDLPHVQLTFDERNKVNLMSDGLYSFGHWKPWRANCRPPNLTPPFCRQFSKQLTTKYWTIAKCPSRCASEINVKALGIYWFSLHLTMQHQAKLQKSSAHLVSKVSIVMEKQGIGKITLRSEIPTPLAGNNGVKLYKVSTSGQLKLHSGSTLKIAVSFKPGAQLHPGTKYIYLYNGNANDTLNWFDFKLVKYMENDS